MMKKVFHWRDCNSKATERCIRATRRSHWIRHPLFRMEPWLWNKNAGSGAGKAKGMHISPVLITCNDDNIASARVIEKRFRLKR